MAKYPSIRFKGFSEEWKESILRQEVNYTSTGVRACDVTAAGVHDLYDANGIIGKIDSVASFAPYISIIKDGSGVGRVRMLPEGTNCIGTMGVITPKGENSIDFIFRNATNLHWVSNVLTS